jgi:hypothetical protein
MARFDSLVEVRCSITDDWRLGLLLSLLTRRAYADFAGLLRKRAWTAGEEDIPPVMPRDLGAGAPGLDLRAVRAQNCGRGEWRRWEAVSENAARTTAILPPTRRRQFRSERP